MFMLYLVKRVAGEKTINEKKKCNVIKKKKSGLVGLKKNLLDGFHK